MIALPNKGNEQGKKGREGSIVGPAAFALVILGTAGLLANEFLTDLGSGITLLFAAVNVIGLIGVGIQLARR